MRTAHLWNLLAPSVGIISGEFQKATASLVQLSTGASPIADFKKIGIGEPPRPTGGQFVLPVWEDPKVTDLSKMLLEQPW